jgi:hypothetical protein
MGKSKNWISGAVKNKGALHKELHVPLGEKIPAKKMKKAAHSSNPKLRKQVTLARTLSGLRKTGPSK